MLRLCCASGQLELGSSVASSAIACGCQKKYLVVFKEELKESAASSRFEAKAKLTPPADGPLCPPPPACVHWYLL